MFRFGRLRGITYTDTIIAGVKSEFRNRVAQVYVLDFAYIIIYPSEHIIEDHTLLSWYFMDYGVPDHLHSDNAWEMNKSNKGKRLVDKEGSIKVP